MLIAEKGNTGEVEQILKFHYYLEIFFLRKQINRGLWAEEEAEFPG